MYNTAKAANRSPSSYFTDYPLDEWTAYQLDRCVTFFGNFIENALLETVVMGQDRVKKYTIQQILDPAFTFPREEDSSFMTEPLLMTEGIIFDEVK